MATTKKQTPKKETPIEWGKNDTCSIGGNPFLKAGPRWREFSKENPQAIFHSIPHFSASGRYAVEVRLFADGDMTKPYISVVVAEDIGQKPKPHLSSIIETRGKSRCIGLFSSRYTLGGEMATYEDVMDAQKPNSKTYVSAEKYETDDDVIEAISKAKSVERLAIIYKKLDDEKQKKFQEMFAKKRQEIDGGKK